jgi:tRNA guanosine-2'-O-methyltransferase
MPWDQIENKKNTEDRHRNDVIMVASLIDKVPNLAGLTRTCEIMNAKGLVVNNGNIIKLEEFKVIAVTA